MKHLIAIMFLLVALAADNQAKAFTDERDQDVQKEEKPMIQTQKPVFCGDAAELLKILIERHKESPILFFNSEIGADGNQSQIVILVNIKTGTASVVENMSNGYACLIGNGNDAMMVPVKVGTGT